MDQEAGTCATEVLDDEEEMDESSSSGSW